MCLSHTATSDVLTLFSCCYLSPRSTRPPAPSALARVAGTVWKISKGHQCEGQERGSFVKRLQFVLGHVTTQSLDSHPLRKRCWKLGMLLFHFEISTARPAAGAPPRLTLLLSFGKHAHSHFSLSGLTRYGINGANRHRREACNNVGREEES